MKIVIVGGVAGGASAAARLRRLDEKAEIVMLERGEYISYANCGLPYYVGDVITDEEELTLQTPESFYARFRVDVRVLSEVKSIDRRAKTVLVNNLQTGENYSESYDKLILSPGADPIRPMIEGECPEALFTLRTVPDALAIKEYVGKNNPKTAVVVGGGFIGLEMAENLVERGIAVTLIEMANQILPPLDYEIACCVENQISSKLQLCLSTGVSCLRKNAGGIEIVTDKGSIISDLVVFAAGVRAETKLAKDAGLKTGVKNCICVSDTMQTSDPDIYAVGDAVETVNMVTGAVGSVPLAGPANKQGRLVADNICGIQRQYKGVLGSSIVKLFDLTVASTGINERSAKAAGIDYDKVYLCPASNASYYPDYETLAMKLLFENGTGRVLGAQMFGRKGVDKRCDVVAAAISGGMTINDLTELDLCYAPPYSSAKDPVIMAGLIAQNILENRVKQYYWDEIGLLPRDGSVFLLDVRTPGEYDHYHPEGYVNIPVDELREHLSELPKDKKIYLICQSALRSYVACRILMQEGYDCAHLAGGMFFYTAIQKGESCLKKAFPCGMER